jgi:hypothetical protein
MSTRALRGVGLILALLPVALLVLLMGGEIAGGDISGIQHLVQIAPVIVFVLIAWRWPAIGGLLLTLCGIALLVLYFVLPPQGLPLAALILTAALLFAPAIMAGILFRAAAQNEARRRSGITGNQAARGHLAS